MDKLVANPITTLEYRNMVLEKKYFVLKNELNNLEKATKEGTIIQKIRYVFTGRLL